MTVPSRADPAAVPSLAGAVRSHASARPHAPAVRQGKTTLGYAELCHRAAGLQAALCEAGVGQGDAVVVAARGLVDLAVGAVAVSGLGAVFCPLDPDDPRTDGYLALVRPRAMVLSRAADARGGAHQVVFLDGTFDSPSDGPNLVDARWDEGLLVESERHDALARLRWSGLLAGAAALADRIGVGVGGRIAVVAAPHTDLALFGLASTLLRGATAICPGHPPAEGDRLRRIVEQADVTVLVSAPRALAVLVDVAAADGVRLPELHTVVLVRDQIPRRLLGSLRNVVRADVRLFDAWGAAETGTIAAVRELDPTDRGTCPIRFERPLGGLSITVGPDGELLCAGAPVVTGHLGRPDLDRADGYAYPTGDQGRVLADGALELAVPSGVTPVRLNQVESLVDGWRDVRIARVVETPGGDVAVFAETASGTRIDPADLRAHLGLTLPEHLLPTLVITVGAMPVTPSGRSDRATLATRAAVLTRRYRAADLPSPGAERILNAVAGALGVPGLDPEMNLYDVGATSLELIRSVSALEEELGFEVDLDELLEVPRVRTLIDQYEAARPVADAARPGRGET
ncbi:non-ribosomal peptide synthetase [Micromonospora lutea]|uniref:Carrier domain-containing protein n=1 Tax=Micromonospora lutea TaxID=419825 RepID=A0ABQ4IT38_9ACTN|nr:non-ribosomal peptide synthetase [Micromonospora lutea]GIJ21071.1 hypothetical protein Vlu01_16950 [Micromonospora lutea]